MNTVNTDRVHDWMFHNSPNTPQSFATIGKAVVSSFEHEFRSRSARKKLWNTLRQELGSDSRFVQTTPEDFALAPNLVASKSGPEQNDEPLQPAKIASSNTSSPDSKVSLEPEHAAIDPHALKGRDINKLDNQELPTSVRPHVDESKKSVDTSKRTPMKQIEAWTVEILRERGTASHFREIIATMEATKALTDADKQPQEGHEEESALAYRCQWAITRLRKMGILKPRRLRGILELSDGSAAVETTPPSVANRKPRPAESGGRKKRRAGKHYTETGGQLLEKYIHEHFTDDSEHTREEIANWFTQNYPRFKRVTVHCTIDQHTTNYPSRVHFSAGPKHDLLFRVDGDPNRLRLYRPGDDPSPIYHLDKPSEEVPDEQKHKPPKHIAAVIPAKEQHRLLLKHLAAYGELAPREAEQLGVAHDNLHAWLDSLLVERPGTRVGSPLFLCLVEVDTSPEAFTTGLAVQLMGEHLKRVLNGSLSELEDYVWTRFGNWHAMQPHAGDPKWHGYLQVPILESRDLAASERLDLFSRLTPGVIGELIRDCSFLAEQQTWSAEAANKGAIGPLSRQMKFGVHRPLFLSGSRLPPPSDNLFDMRILPKAEVLQRRYVVAGLPSCSAQEWEDKVKFSHETLAERLLEHPVHALIVQLEIHRLFAGINGQDAAVLRVNDQGELRLELDGIDRDSLWAVCRKILGEIGYWQVGSAISGVSWSVAINAAIDNLEMVGVLQREGGVVRLTEKFASDAKAHPVLPQNRGEKAFRIQLAKILEGLHGGAT